ncbi:MAG: DUF4919 domain-containing protein [bacterium]|nr:MAG: DUF4919 domain-containing protein [bacterium]
MKKGIILSSIIFCYLFNVYLLYSQEKNIPFQFDHENLQKLTNNPESQYYYAKLLNRFLENDTTLTHHELFLLCYGYSQSENYAPYSHSHIEDSLYQLNDDGNYKQALEFGKQYLKINPVSITGNVEMAYAYKKLGLIDLEKIHYNRYIHLIKCLLVHGTGNSIDDPYIVFNPRDEYRVIGYLGYQRTQQALIVDSLGQHYDVLTVVPKNKKETERDIYFYIEIPFSQLSKLFKN